VGIVSQLEIGTGDLTLSLPWDNFGQWRNVPFEKIAFSTFLKTASNSPVAITNQAPFTPQVKVCHRLDWQANDPLVHYMDEDLRRPEGPRFSGAHTNYAGDRLKFNILKENEAYKPWRPDGVDVSDPSKGKLYANLHITDPNIHTSDNWEFPTNKFPSIGWLGRVHRGTPWQTIYFKPWFPTQDWGAVHYSMRAHPTNDWRLADIFTVAQHPNASRGRLSVNQTNVAGWSAVLSGIPITTFAGTPAGKTTNIVEPVVNEPYVERLVEAINTRRETLRGKVFHNLAEFLSVNELTTLSPYLTPPYAPSPPTSEDTPLRDEDYERIPEAILSLIKPGEARFDVYIFGQSLKPAPQSIVPSGNYRGLCLNYEVTGEMAAKAVMRVDLDYQANRPPRPRAVVESYNILPPD
jgi:hypothetical protein